MTQGLIGHHSMEAPTPGNNWKFNGFVWPAHKIRQPLKGELTAKKIAFDHELPDDPPTGTGAGPLRMTTSPAEDRNTLQSTQAIIKKETLPQLFLGQALSIPLQLSCYI